MTRRSSTPALSWLLAELTVLTASWNGITIGSYPIVDFVMIPTVVAVLFHLAAKGQPLPIPWWLAVMGVGIGLTTLLATMFPAPDMLAQHRVIPGSPLAGPIQSNPSHALKFLGGIVLIPLLVAAVATTRERCRRLADLWVFASLASAVIAITDLLGYTHVSAIVQGVDARPAGLASQPNHLALTCAMGLPVVATWLTRGRPWQSRTLVVGGLLLGGVYASGSRAGTIAAVLAVLATVLVVPGLRRTLPTFAPVAGMIIIALAFSSVPRQIAQKVRLTATANVAVSDQARSFSQAEAIQDIGARPVAGVGFSVIDDAHEIYLQLLAAGGGIMLAAFLFYLLGVGRMIRRLLRTDASTLALALGVSLLVWLLNGFVGNQVADRYIFVPVGLLLALSTCCPASVPAPAAATVAEQQTLAIVRPGVGAA